MKLDTSLWDNGRRMRERLVNLATAIGSICAINLFYAINQRNWWISGLNGLFLLTTTLPIVLSHSKWKKLPPKDVDMEDNDESKRIKRKVTREK